MVCRSPRHRSLLLAGTLVTLAACAPKDPADTDATTATATTTDATDATSGASGTSTSSALTTTANTSGSDGDSESSGTTTLDPTASTTAVTTGAPACVCGPDEFCDWNTNGCGLRFEEGVCAARPPACDQVLDPVCGCDGEVYGNACEAASQGVDVAEAGGCAPPEGMFPCGFRFCSEGAEFCVVEVSDVGGLPDGFGCAALPPGCDPPGCACLADVPCGELCEQLPSGDLVVTCPGG